MAAGLGPSILKFPSIYLLRLASENAEELTQSNPGCVGSMAELANATSCRLRQVAIQSDQSGRLSHLGVYETAERAFRGRRLGRLKREKYKDVRRA